MKNNYGTAKKETRFHPERRTYNQLALKYYSGSFQSVKFQQSAENYGSWNKAASLA
jgi:hypothetical protein